MTTKNNNNAMLIHPNQRQNPLIQCLANTAFAFHDGLNVDFHISQSICALFLSIRYHRLHPHYLHTRMTTNRSALEGYTRRVVLLKVDVDDGDANLLDLNVLCAAQEWTLLVGFTDDELAFYLFNLKVCL
jgi:DNA excision repair protein ERCC-1